MRLKQCFAVLISAGLLVGLASAQGTMPLPGRINRITSVEGVTEYQLANGLRILLVPDPSKAVVNVNVTYLVGSRQERYGETGMAHLLEHLMFKGTPSHPNIPDELSKHGAQPNGTTTYDRTNYFETFEATDENFDWALSMEADRMVNSFIARKDLDSEMTVVRNELERNDDHPESVLTQRVLETAFIWHNYGHPTLGARSDVEGVRIESLQAFYRMYYQPDNAVLIVAGKFDEDKALDLIQKRFGSIPRPLRELPTLYTQEPAQDGPREVVLRRIGDRQVVMVQYHIPAAGHPDTVALGVLADVLSDPTAGRLHQRLVKTKLATSAAADVMSLHDPGVMKFVAVLSKDGEINAARQELLKVAQGVAQEPITEAELDRARAQELQQYEKLLTDTTAISMMLSEALANGDWRLLFWQRDALSKVTVSDLQRAAGKYLIPSNVTVGMFIPDEKPVRADIPPTPDYAVTLKGYTGRNAVAAGEQFEPTPSNIEARTIRTSAGPITMAFVPKKTRGHLVNFFINVHFGDEESLRGRVEAATIAGNLLMRGTSKHDRTQLQDELTSIKTQMRAAGDAEGASVALQTDREHLAAALRFAAEVLQQPSFPEQEFDELKRNRLLSLESRRTDPQAIAELAMERALSSYPPESIRYVPTLEEAIARLKATTLGDVRKFYREFYGIAQAEVSAAGDFDPDELASLVSELFGDWKSPRPYRRVPSVYKPILGKTESFNTPDKENAVFLTGTNMELRDDDPEYPGMMLGNYMLGGGFLNSRLAVRIRQKEGLSYNVGSQVSAGALDRVGSFTGFAICAPQNEAKIAKAFQEELARALKEGFTAEELAAAKSGYLQSREVMRSDDGFLAGMLAQRLFQRRDFHWDEEYERKVRALTPDQVNEAMRHFIDPNKLVVMGAGDFSKAGS